MMTDDVSNNSANFAITVVIPAYNAELTVANTIKSVLSQTYQAARIIVVNDGSTDNTSEIVKSFGDSVSLVEQKNQGVSTARNTGIENATTPWVAFLDSDDTWLPGKLEAQVEFLKSKQNIKWCSTRYYQCIGNSKSLSAFPEPANPPNLPTGQTINALHSIAAKTNIWVSTVLIQKSLVLEAGGFHPPLSSTADNDLWIRVCKLSPETGFINTPLANYMVDPNGMSRSAAKAISPSRYLFFERLAEHIADSKDADRQYFESIFDRYAGAYMFNVARAGNLPESKKLLAWLRENEFRIPSFKFRWIQWIPPSFISFLKWIRRS